MLFSIRPPSMLPMIIFPISQKSIMVIMFKSFNLQQFDVISIKCPLQTTFCTSGSTAHSFCQRSIRMAKSSWTKTLNDVIKFPLLYITISQCLIEVSTCIRPIFQLVSIQTIHLRQGWIKYRGLGSNVWLLWPGNLQFQQISFMIHLICFGQSFTDIKGTVDLNA